MTAKKPEKWRIMVGFPFEWKTRIKTAAETIGLNTEQWINHVISDKLDGLETPAPEPPEVSGGGGAGEEFTVETPVPAQFAEKLSDEELMVEINTVMQQMMEDFQYPMNAKGDQMDMRFLTPWVAFHLVRCGWRPVDNRRAIKKRPATYIPPGCYEDLVEWVPVDTPDEMDPSNMTLAEIQGAPASVQAEAIRQMGGHADKVLPAGTDMAKLWKQPVNISVDDPDFEQHQKEASQ